VRFRFRGCALAAASRRLNNGEFQGEPLDRGRITDASYAGNVNAFERMELRMPGCCNGGSHPHIEWMDRPPLERIGHPVPATPHRRFLTRGGVLFWRALDTALSDAHSKYQPRTTTARDLPPTLLLPCGAEDPPSAEQPFCHQFFFQRSPAKRFARGVFWRLASPAETIKRSLKKEFEGPRNRIANLTVDGRP